MPSSNRYTLSICTSIIHRHPPEVLRFAEVTRKKLIGDGSEGQKRRGGGGVRGTDGRVDIWSARPSDENEGIGASKHVAQRVSGVATAVRGVEIISVCLEGREKGGLREPSENTITAFSERSILYFLFFDVFLSER